MLNLDPDDTSPRSGARLDGELTRDEIMRVLEDEIVEGILKPGDRIDERALAERFSVSRTPVRDAIGRLASRGLIEVKPRSGSYVAQMHLSSLLQLFELMSDLEGLCAFYAAQRMDQAELDALKQFADLCLKASHDKPEDYAVANFKFHNAIYCGSKNTYLESLTRQARRRLAAYRKHTFRLPGRLRRSAEEHLGVVDAIGAGDSETARQLMARHTDIRREDFIPFITMMAERSTR